MPQASEKTPVSSRPQSDSGNQPATRPNDPDTDRSAELLRLALPMISRHGRGFAPISYAIWYEYVRGENPDLREELDEAVNADKRLSEDQTFEMYHRHVVSSMEKAVLAGRAGLLEVLEDVDNSVDNATESTSRFGDQLGSFEQVLDTDSSADELRNHVSSLKDDIHSVNSSIRDLHERLDGSRQEVERLAQELALAKEQAQIDPLSGLLNRRGFEQILNGLMDKFNEDKSGAREPIALLLLDIDHFKKVNDQHGHIFGDKVIQGVSKILDGGVMRKDHVCRFGGEEFAILLPGTDKAGAVAVGERVRQAVASSRIKRGNSSEPVDQITISGGVSIYQADEVAGDFIERADQALYRAKESGRNQICS